MRVQIKKASIRRPKANGGYAEVTVDAGAIASEHGEHETWSSIEAALIGSLNHGLISHQVDCPLLTRSVNPSTLTCMH